MALVKIKKKYINIPGLDQETGAATVEFAFAMIALFGFFAIYMQFVQIFIASERLAFAGFAASRTCAVKGEGPAIAVAVEIDPEAAIAFKPGEIEMTRHVPIPEGIDRFLTRGQGRFTVIHQSPLFIEPAPEDDNPAPF
ncbi:MAG: hypothetical protein C4518_19050 [Desulfobacteraceae bacterium]|nr:MAG: hypothetical protein C4518_19050 [Desulfobacteraceae bacterium]